MRTTRIERSGMYCRVSIHYGFLLSSTTKWSISSPAFYGDNKEEENTADEVSEVRNEMSRKRHQKCLRFTDNCSH